MKTDNSVSANGCARRVSPKVLLAAILAGAVTANAAIAQSSINRSVAFDIPAQSLESALHQFAEQADVQVLVRTDTVSGTTTSGVKGNLSIPNALTRLLKDTHLVYETVGNSITVRSDSDARSSAGAKSPPTPRESTKHFGGSEEAAASTATNDVSDTRRPASVEEVVVTGSHLRGQQESFTTNAITRQEIERTGFTSIGKVIESIPQNFAGVGATGFFGATEGGSKLDRANYDRASSPNLRGLGAESTLTLVDGMRQAGSVRGRVVDLSAIPLSMIERVDVVTGGNSAIYGSDAVGGVVNLITRRDIERPETQVAYSGTRGGGERLVASQLAGTRSENGESPRELRRLVGLSQAAIAA